jgi:hypothetical protein
MTTGNGLVNSDIPSWYVCCDLSPHWMTVDVQRRRSYDGMRAALGTVSSMTGARLKEVISKRKYGKNVRALQLPAEFLRE